MEPPGPRIGILGIGSASAPFAVRQAELLRALAPSRAPGSARERLARRLFLDAAIEERRFCIPDFAHPEHAVLYDGTPPTPSRRMSVYRSEAPRLAAEACERALKSACVAPGEVTHLVVVTCTGIFTPGPDVELVSRLGLRPEVERTLVAFMGCSGAFHALRVGRRAAAASHVARVLVACVELCSLHRRDDARTGHLVSQSLFADGAGALVLGGVEAQGAWHAELGAASTLLGPGTRDALTWELGDDGFEVRLSPRLPSLIERALPGFLAGWLVGKKAGAPEAWVVHPGGAAILRAVQRALRVEREAIASAWSVLGRLGNTSSAAVLYVLEEELSRAAKGRDGLMLGFGPGLTLEALSFRRGARAG